MATEEQSEGREPGTITLAAGDTLAERLADTDLSELDTASTDDLRDRLGLRDD